VLDLSTFSLVIQIFKKVNVVKFDTTPTHFLFFSLTFYFLNEIINLITYITHASRFNKYGDHEISNMISMRYP